jgi:CheY-like chemotaxis protein
MEPTQILLVEDDPNDVELIQIALDSYNFVNQINVVSDGEQAVHYIFGRDGQPPTQPLARLVLLDLKLPYINGIQILEMKNANFNMYKVQEQIKNNNVDINNYLADLNGWSESQNKKDKKAPTAAPTAKPS